jgi:hypothetical protein
MKSTIRTKRNRLTARTTGGLIASVLLLTATVACGNDVREAALRDPDFLVQGEYTGELDDGVAALQVAAQGHGQFEVLFYRGGLPGDGWDGREPVRFTAERRNERVGFVHDHLAGVHTGDAFMVRSGPDAEPRRLERVERASPHEGAPPPDDAIVLFDGSSVDAFEGGARMTDDGLLIEGATTRLRVEDMVLHLEFMIGFMPHARDQGRGNSGVYIQQRYEVQILDSFAKLPAHNIVASLYRERSPDLNMAYPPGQWQTYRIHFTAPRFDEHGHKTANARFTVYHNGVKVHDDVELPHGTGMGKGRGEGGAGPVYFQSHTGPVRFRNIWVQVP